MATIKKVNSSLNILNFLMDVFLLINFSITVVYSFYISSFTVNKFNTNEFGGFHNNRYRAFLICAGLVWIFLIVAKWMKKESVSSLLINTLRNSDKRKQEFFILVFLVLPSLLGSLGILLIQIVSAIK